MDEDHRHEYMLRADVMIDIETLATTPDAYIVSIGAVTFCPLVVGQYLFEFYRKIYLNHPAKVGGRVSQDTLSWWEKQKNKEETFSVHGRVTLLRALNELSGFIQQHTIKRSCIWGSGANFDNVVLAEAYKRVGLEIPWSFRQDRCYRTITAPYKEDVDAYYKDFSKAYKDVKHHALWDARRQHYALVRIIDKYNLTV